MAMTRGQVCARARAAYVWLERQSSSSRSFTVTVGGTARTLAVREAMGHMLDMGSGHCEVADITPIVLGEDVRLALAFLEGIESYMGAPISRLWCLVAFTGAAVGGFLLYKGIR